MDRRFLFCTGIVVSLISYMKLMDKAKSELDSLKAQMKTAI